MVDTKTALNLSEMRKRNKTHQKNRLPVKYCRSLLISLFWLILFFSSDSLAEKKNFRTVNWGMTRLEVMANEETAPESFGLLFLFYKSEIEGRKFDLIYEFVENRLTEAVYIFVAHQKNDYLWVKKMVETKYGRPLVSFDGGYRNYRYKWKSSETEITLKPGKDRECRLEYIGRRYQNLEREKAKIVSVEKKKGVFRTF